MINSAESKLAELFDVLQIDHRNDDHTRETPRRVARMFVEEIMQGRYSDPPVLTDFDNVEAFDQLIVTGPIEIRSTCAHHLMPIYGEAYIGVLPAWTDGSSACRNTIGWFIISRRGCRSRRSWSGRLASSSWTALRRAAWRCASVPSTCARRIAACGQSSQPHGHGQLFR